MRREPGKMACVMNGLGQDATDPFGTFSAADIGISDTSAPPDASGAVTDIFGTSVTASAPAIDASAFTPPPTLDDTSIVSLGIDLNKAVAYGGAVYKYVKQVTAAGKTTYVPQRVGTAATAPGASMFANLPTWALPAGLALAAFFFLRRR